MDISFDIPVPIILDESFSVFKWSSFSRGYHVYKDRCQPTVGDDSLHCQQEKDIEYNKHGVAIIYDSFHSNKVLGQIPFYWSKFANTFLKFPSHHIRLVGVGKNVCEQRLWSRTRDTSWLLFSWRQSSYQMV